jgi:Family of unknown function (DUF5670)
VTKDFVWSAASRSERFKPSGKLLIRNKSETDYRRLTMLWTIVVVLLILWLLGFSFHIAGGLIHLLLVVALVVVVINLISGRRGTI